MNQQDLNDIVNNDYITAKQCDWAINHIDQIVKEEHTTKEALVDDDFDFAKSLELEGFFAVPNDDELVFDCGEHDNRGILLPHSVPTDDYDVFKQSLLLDLSTIYLTKIQQEKGEI